MATNNTSKNTNYFECISCDFKCSKKGDYNRHILTPKHKKSTESTKIDINTSIFICEKCNKNYKDRSGLWRHKNKCNKTEIGKITPEMIVEIIKQNQDFKDMLLHRMNLYK